MGVTENTKGTIPEAEGRKEISLAAQGKTPESASKVSPAEPVKSYSQTEVDRLLQATKSEEGRKHTAELTTLRKEKEALAEIADDRAALQKQIDELSSKDPEVFNLAKKDKELRERDKQMAKRASELSEKYDARIERMEAFETEVAAHQIAEEFENGDADKLTAFCKKFKIIGEDKIREAAETLWDKKKPEPQPPPAKPFTGMTDGGSGEKTVEERLRERYPSMYPKK